MHFVYRTLTAALTTDDCLRSIVRIWVFSAVTSSFILVLLAPCGRRRAQESAPRVIIIPMLVAGRMYLSTLVVLCCRLDIFGTAVSTHL